MRKGVWLLVVVAVFSACRQSANVETERNALLAADRAWSLNANDTDKFVSYYAPEAAVYPQGMPVVTDTAAIREFANTMHAMPGFSLQWSAAKAEVSASGDVGYTAGTYQMAMNDAAGNPVNEKGKYIAIWKKIDGNWKVTEDIFNSDAPPPPVTSPALDTPLTRPLTPPPPPLTSAP